jgi:hypothetical protein
VWAGHEKEAHWSQQPLEEMAKYVNKDVVENQDALLK